MYVCMYLQMQKLALLQSELFYVATCQSDNFTKILVHSSHVAEKGHWISGEHLDLCCHIVTLVEVKEEKKGTSQI